MKEIIPQNQNPLNHLCKSLLEKAGEQTGETSLYALQVVMWFLENHRLAKPYDQIQMSLEGHVAGMTFWKNPDNALTFLVTMDGAPIQEACAAIGEGTTGEKPGGRGGSI